MSETRIWVDPQLAMQPTKKRIKNRMVEVYPSPYDIPESISAELIPSGVLQNDEVLRIHFQYPGGKEPVWATELRPGVYAKFGANSNRVQEIELHREHVKQMSPGELSEVLLAALEMGNLSDRVLSGNYGVAGNCVRLHEHQLLGPLTR